MLNKIKAINGKLMAFLMLALLSVQSFAQTTGLTLPASAKEDLTDIINGSFGVVIGVVVLVVGAGLLIKLIRKAG